MVHVGCAFVADIHPLRTWPSGSFESVRWNAFVADIHPLRTWPSGSFESVRWNAFVADIHPLRTWPSGSFESVRWNASVRTRSRFMLSSERVLGGMESEPMLSPREKYPLPVNFPQRRIEPSIYLSIYPVVWLTVGAPL